MSLQMKFAFSALACLSVIIGSIFMASYAAYLPNGTWWAFPLFFSSFVIGIPALIFLIGIVATTDLRK